MAIWSRIISRNYETCLFQHLTNFAAGISQISVVMAAYGAGLPFPLYDISPYVSRHYLFVPSSFNFTITTELNRHVTFFSVRLLIIMPSKALTVCNWVPSTVTEDNLKEFFTIGFLPGKNVMSYRAPDPDEERPNPKDGEVIVFSDHMNRGFSPPGSKFFRNVLHFFKLHPQDLGPNSISNICNFQVLCEVYLHQEPTMELFREYFYLNR